MTSNVTLTALDRIKTSGGEVMKALRSDEIGFRAVNEAYFSQLAPNAIRAWKLHKEMTVNAIVPVGEVRFVIAHPEPSIEFEEHILGPESFYGRLTIPPGLWFGFQAGPMGGIVLNLSDVLHRDDESEKAPEDQFSFVWRR